MKKQLLKFYRNNMISFDITIRGNCMYPILKDGEKVSITPQKDYQKGDIILCEDSSEFHYIHRIIDISRDNYNNLVYTTKADNNVCIDADRIPLENIFGKVNE